MSLDALIDPDGGDDRYNPGTHPVEIGGGRREGAVAVGYRKIYDTRKVGRSNSGHMFRDTLSEAERMAVIESRPAGRVEYTSWSETSGVLAR